MDKLTPPLDQVFVHYHVQLVSLFAHHVVTPNIQQVTLLVPSCYVDSGKITVPIMRKTDYYHNISLQGIRILHNIYTTLGIVFKAGTLVQYRIIKDMMEEILRVRWRPAHRKKKIRGQIDAMIQTSNIIPIAIRYISWMAHLT